MLSEGSGNYPGSHTGQFKPGLEAHPTIGKVGELEYVEEDRVEVIVNDKGAQKELGEAIEELKKVSFQKLERNTIDVGFVGLV